MVLPINELRSQLTPAPHLGMDLFDEHGDENIEMMGDFKVRITVCTVINTPASKRAFYVGPDQEVAAELRIQIESRIRGLYEN